MAVGTTIQGQGGHVQIGAGTVWNMKVESYTATFNYATIETTGFTDRGHQVHEAVSSVVTGTITGVLTHNASNTAPIPAALVDGAVMAVGDLDNARATIFLHCQSTGTGSDIQNGWSIPAVIESHAIDRPQNGRASGTLTFRSRGAPTQTWDETA